MKIVVLGLSLSSSWGNGHATTWRALLKGVTELGHDVLFLERRTPWYAAHRDPDDPSWPRLRFYDSVRELDAIGSAEMASADVVIVGSYTPDGVEVIDLALARAPGRVSFYDIDTPVTLAALDAGLPTYIAPRQIPRLSVYFSFTGGPTLKKLEGEYNARKALALYCCVDPEGYAPVETPRRWDLGYLGTYSDDRQPALERLLLEPARLLPHMRFVVAGPQYPADIRWPANVERIDHIPPHGHARFYSAQRFTLNVTRADMVRAGWSPSVRLFEAACCGAPIISDVWEGLDELLAPGREILFARSTNDVVSILQETSADRRREVGQAARRRALAEHTGVMRARGLIESVAVEMEV